MTRVLRLSTFNVSERYFCLNEHYRVVLVLQRDLGGFDGDLDFLAPVMALPSRRLPFGGPSPFGVLKVLA